jgi:hypothetical protein
MVSYTESQWISLKYSECFLIALFLYKQLTIYGHIVTRRVPTTIQHDHDGSLFT